MARLFNGSSDSILLPGTTDLISAGAAWTAAAWIYPIGLPVTFRAIHSKRGVGTNWEFYVNSFGVGAYNGTNLNNFGTLVTSTWQHALAACDSGSFIAYINGMSVGSDPSNYGAGTSTAAPIQIGDTSVAGGSDFFPGRIADAALWNVKLTAQEALALGQGARPYQIRPSALLFWLPLDGIQSTEPDLSGFARNGTLTGTSLAFGPPNTPFSPRRPRFLDTPTVVGPGWPGNITITITI